MPPSTAAGTGSRPERRMRTSDFLKHVAFIAMLACAIWIFFLGLTSKSDKPAFSDIGGASLSLLLQISLGVWCFFALVYTGIILHYAKRHPFWPLLTLLIVLLMTAFFTSYLAFDPMDWSTWGPLAAVMGVVVKEGFHHTYNSSERGQLAALRDCLMGNAGEEGGDDGNDDNNDRNGNNNRNIATSANDRRDGQELSDMSHCRANVA